MKIEFNKLKEELFESIRLDSIIEKKTKKKKKRKKIKQARFFPSIIVPFPVRPPKHGPGPIPPPPHTPGPAGPPPSAPAPSSGNTSSPLAI